MLVECLALHEPALRASFLHEYRARCTDFDPLEAAELLAWIPQGSAVWRAVGGPMSLTAAEHSLRFIEYHTRFLAWRQTQDGQKGHNPPSPPQKIPFAADAVAVESFHERQMASRRRREAAAAQ